VPQLQDNTKHIALIVDFGGGTFDVCVIESTSMGDISLSGKHSKPLASNSIPLGGFAINREIAKYLIKRNLEGTRRKKADQVFSTYLRVIKGDQKLGTLNAEKTAFIKNIERLEEAVEKYKITLVNSISDWKIDSNCYEKVTISLPKNPFESGKWVESEFRGHELRNIFISEIWNKSIKREVNRVLERADEKLKGKKITTTLMSGGSSNIKWLIHLLKKEFSDQLDHAEPLSLSNSFQEIVAKGLAIECARRYYENSSEFVSVTYNPIHLLLDPDKKGIETKPFTSIENKVDMKDAKQGDLVPSAQSLRHFFDEPLQWKVRLGHPPKRVLYYYFTRPGAKEDINDRYNLEQHMIHTRDNKHFDSQIRVELTVREDGTAKPRFIYRVGNDEVGIKENSEEGSQFAIDMTTESASEKTLSRYIGFDFGTSNSSVSILNQNEVEIIEARNKNESWVSLKDSLQDLPYPVAITVRKYLDVSNAAESVAIAREAFESALAFLAYVVASEAMSHNLLGTTMQHFPHRSMGPLIDLIKKSLALLGKKAIFSMRIKKSFEQHEKQLNMAMSEFTDHKHDKMHIKDVSARDHLLMLVNICRHFMQGRYFGFIVNHEKVKFKKNEYKEEFKIAHDNQPFVTRLKIKTKDIISTEEPLIIDTKKGICLSIFPFMFWTDSECYMSPHNCYLLDKYDKQTDQYILKPCSKRILEKAKEISPDLDQMYRRLWSDGLNGDVNIVSFNVIE
jgi:hypothetical protein